MLLCAFKNSCNLLFISTGTKRSNYFWCWKVGDFLFVTLDGHLGSNVTVLGRIKHCFVLAVAILPSMAIYPQRLFCCELFVIGQSK